MDNTPKTPIPAAPLQAAPPKPKFKFPTEFVDLPSNGIVYPKSNPLSLGKLEMKYMTAKEEDIITNQSYISKGIIIDKTFSLSEI